MNNKTIIEFGFRIILRIMEISEGVIRLLNAVIKERFPFMMHTTFSEDGEMTAPC